MLRYLSWLDPFILRYLIWLDPDIILGCQQQLMRDSA